MTDNKKPCYSDKLLPQFLSESQKKDCSISVSSWASILARLPLLSCLSSPGTSESSRKRQEPPVVRSQYPKKRCQRGHSFCLSGNRLKDLLHLLCTSRFHIHHPHIKILRAVGKICPISFFSAFLRICSCL
jgi:hypothetical protein